MKKQCKICDFKNFVRHGRGELRCPNCGRDITIEFLAMYKESDWEDYTYHKRDHRRCSGDQDGHEKHVSRCLCGEGDYQGNE